MLVTVKTTCLLPPATTVPLDSSRVAFRSSSSAWAGAENSERELATRNAETAPNNRRRMIKFPFHASSARYPADGDRAELKDSVVQQRCLTSQAAEPTGDARPVNPPSQ